MKIGTDVIGRVIGNPVGRLSYSRPWVMFPIDKPKNTRFIFNSKRYPEIDEWWDDVDNSKYQLNKGSSLWLREFLRENSQMLFETDFMAGYISDKKVSHVYKKLLQNQSIIQIMIDNNINPKQFDLVEKYISASDKIL
jgi:hypothetical protein